MIKYVKSRSSQFEIEKINKKRKILIYTKLGNGFVLLEKILNRLETERKVERRDNLC